MSKYNQWEKWEKLQKEGQLDLIQKSKNFGMTKKLPKVKEKQQVGENLCCK